MEKEYGIISAVIQHYFPEWKPPKYSNKEWISCYCPAHKEDNPSASISFKNGAIKCHSCGYSGDIYKVIMKEGGVNFGEAKRLAEEFAVECGSGVLPPAAGESGRGVFGNSRPSGRGHKRGSKQIQARLRRRPFTGI